MASNSTQASSSGAGLAARIPSIPRGTREFPAKPVNEVVTVDDLPDMTDEWSNKAAVMELELYFDGATSNLATGFNICGLQPVIRQVDGSTFMLKDMNNNFYRWDSEAPGLFWIVEATDLKSALEQIIYHPIMMKTQRVGRALHTAEAD